MKNAVLFFFTYINHRYLSLVPPLSSKTSLFSLFLLLFFLLHLYLHPPSFSVKAGNTRPALRLSGGAQGLQRVINMCQRKSLDK